MKNNLPKLMIMLFCIGMFTVKSFAQSNDAATNEIISIVKAQWAAEMASPTNITEQMKNISDDYTEFNGDYATRMDGKAMSVRIAEAGSKDGSQTLAAEMLNPKVQVYGDVAILTYNFAGLAKNGKGEVKPVRAKSTRIYAKQNGKWMMVHANFAPDPAPSN